MPAPKNHQDARTDKATIKHKRGQGEGSIYQRDDGRWTATLSLGYADGKRQRKSVYGRTRREVQEKLTPLLHNQQRGIAPVNERLTVGTYLDRWLTDSAQSRVRATTYDRYARHVALHLKPELGRIVLAKLAPADVQAFLNRKAAKLAPGTVLFIFAVLRQALKQALRWGLVVRNVAALVDPPRLARHEIEPFTPEQARTFLEAVRGERLAALYTVATALGLRQGEALGLRWADVDLERGVLQVRHSLQRTGGTLRLTEPKTERSRRTIALPTVAVAALREHRVRQLEHRLLAGERWQDQGFVFTTRNGTPVDGRALSRAFPKLLERLGLPRIRFHDLRHTCATLLLVQGVQPRVVMETLGHSQIGITMNLYSHVVPELQRHAAAQMDEALAAR